MSRVSISTVLEAPPSQVWTYLEDIGSHVEWMSDAIAIRFISPRRTGVGTRYECDTRVGPLRLTDVMEVTEWVPGQAMGVRHVGLVTGTGRFTLDGVEPGRTWFTWSEQLSFPWRRGGPLAALVARPLLTRVWRDNLRNLSSRF